MIDQTIEETCRDNLLAVAGEYGRATGLARATVSRQFHGNNAFLDEFRCGKCSVTLSKFQEMLDAFRSKWPKGARWPWLRAVVIAPPERKVATAKSKAVKNKPTA